MSSVLRIPCVLVALERERLFLHDTLRIVALIPSAPVRAWLCAQARQYILVIETGVGKSAAERAVAWLLTGPLHDGRIMEPGLLLFAGFAGALHESLEVGEVILATEVIDLHGNRWSPPAKDLPLPFRDGRLLTVDHFVGEPAEKRALGVRHDAIIVDMESSAFARLCSERGQSWACLRVVSDDVSVPFSTEIAGLVENGQVSMVRVFSLLARKPWRLPTLLRLDRQTRLAARRLADAVIQFLACSSAG